MNPLERGRTLINQVRTGAQNTVNRAQNAVGTVVDTARNVASATGQRINTVVDGFETKATQGARAVQGLFGGGNQPDRVHDGKLLGANGQTFPPGTPLANIPGVTPRNNPNPNTTVLYVNGIQTNLAGQANSLQAIADTTGARVIGIHNATEGFAADLAQCVKDKLDKGTNPAVDTLADTLYTEIQAGRNVHLMAHSQGGLISSRALGDVYNRLRIEDGMSKAQVEQTMSRINVETFGAAAWSYPDGPKYVHYVNNKDIVPTWFGQGNGKGLDDWALRDGGKGAVVRRFEHGSGIQGTHGLNDAYLPQRVPFDQARAGQ